MLDLGALKLSIKVDSQEANEELGKAKKSIGEVAGDLKNKLVSATKTAIAGLAGLATGAVALAESTREYRTEQAKLQTAFEDAGHTAEDAKNTYSELNSILGDSGQATEAANHLAKLCDTQEELSTWTTISTGVYATFGDSLPIESLTEAANETAKTGALTGALADALNWAGVSEDEFQSSLDKCNTEQERQALITETLNGLYDDAAEKYRTNAEDVIAANEANQRFQDTLATIAGVLEPVITKVKSFAADGLERIANIVVEHQDSIDKFVDAIASFGNFILDNSEMIISGLVGIGTGLAVFNIASIIMKLVEAFKAMKAAEEGLTIAQAALNVVMNANPFVLIISLVAGLVAAFNLFSTSVLTAFVKAVSSPFMRSFIVSALSATTKSTKAMGKPFSCKICEAATLFSASAKLRSFSAIAASRLSSSYLYFSSALIAARRSASLIASAFFLSAFFIASVTRLSPSRCKSACSSSIVFGSPTCSCCSTFVFSLSIFNSSKFYNCVTL